MSLTISRAGWLEFLRDNCYVLNPHWDEDLSLFRFGKAETLCREALVAVSCPFMHNFPLA